MYVKALLAVAAQNTLSCTSDVRKQSQKLLDRSEQVISSFCVIDTALAEKPSHKYHANGKLHNAQEHARFFLCFFFFPAHFSRSRLTISGCRAHFHTHMRSSTVHQGSIISSLYLRRWGLLVLPSGMVFLMLSQKPLGSATCEYHSIVSSRPLSNVIFSSQPSAFSFVVSIS